MSEVNLYYRSGEVKIESKLVSFLYDLMRDHVPPGVVEKLMEQAERLDDIGAVSYTNGWLASYAEDVARRLGDSPQHPYDK
jgi:hypothetical protein